MRLKHISLSGIGNAITRTSKPEKGLDSTKNKYVMEDSNIHISTKKRLVKNRDRRA